MKILKTVSVLVILTLCIGTMAFASNEDSNLIEIQDYDLDKQTEDTSFVSAVPEINPNSIDLFAIKTSGIENGVNPRSIIGSDDRTIITNTKKAPFKFIGKMIMEYKDGFVSGGTGFLIGDSTLMTAAHCVYSSQHGGYPAKVTFYPGRTGNTNPYGVITAKKIHVPKKFTTDANSNLYDYAVVELNSTIGRQNGFFNDHIGFIEPEYTNTMMVSGVITGYNGNTLYRGKGKFTVDIKAKKITYTIDTDHGQSGAPIYENVNGDFIVYGIHTSGAGTYNEGRYLSSEVWNLVNKYI